MATFDAIAGLPLEIEGYELEDRDRIYGDFTRGSTVIHMRGAGQEGVGEDVVYDVLDHIAQRDAGPVLDLTGPATLGEFCALVRRARPLPGLPPVRESSATTGAGHSSRAALDLALRQSGISLHEALGRDPKPLTFVCSTRLSSFGDDGPPAPSRCASGSPSTPTCASSSTPRTTGRGADRGAKEIAAVDVLDLKGHLQGTPVDVETDPELYAGSPRRSPTPGSRTRT